MPHTQILSIDTFNDEYLVKYAGWKDEKNQAVSLWQLIKQSPESNAARAAAYAAIGKRDPSER